MDLKKVLFVLCSSSDDETIISLSCAVCFRNCLAKSSFWKRADHDCSSIIIAPSIVMFVNFLSESITLMYLRITLVRYLAFNDCITPWSISCVTKVVFWRQKDEIYARHIVCIGVSTPFFLPLNISDFNFFFLWKKCRRKMHW